ncbi:hypothetical protein CPB84DRAFT_1714594 [Gymnopilus junonius]|uniref:Uncharacterized protein n=1 Tax=Gymnopilus junonius TaxID=109634 RepID=A0A9P5NC86_GYMJU|nr:hypothetical protein CPB84DRAFT_1714594 [Gymnopilus junonius]
MDNFLKQNVGRMDNKRNEEKEFLEMEISSERDKNTVFGQWMGHFHPRRNTHTKVPMRGSTYFYRVINRAEFFFHCIF